MPCDDIQSILWSNTCDLPYSLAYPGGNIEI